MNEFEGIPAFLERRPSNGAQLTFDALAIVSKYLDLREHLENLTADFKEKTAPFKNAMEVLEQAAAELMRETKQTSLPTEAGTAYQQHGLSATCSDVTTFHEWVFQYQQRQFLTAHISKEAVKEYMDNAGDGHPPPGVKVETFVKINFRRK